MPALHAIPAAPLLPAAPAPVPTGWLAGPVLPRAENATSASLSSASQASASASASRAMSSLSSVAASATQAMSSESTLASGQSPNPSYFKIIGILLAVASGAFIGASFVFKKKGLLRAQAKYQTIPGQGVQYLKSPLWWTGMTIMILGEACNLIAYSFAQPIEVTPMGALSVVISAILSHFVLSERLTLFGWLGCALCVLGSAIIGLNGGEQGAEGDIRQFEKLFVTPGFLVWLGICVLLASVLAVFAMPRWGNKYMLIPISICSTIGGLSVSMTSGVGASIVLSIRGQNQVTYWFFWLLVGLTAITLVVEILYLNKALEVHGTAMVTATYYVLFTSMSLVSTIVLHQGMQARPEQIVSLVLAFLVTCIGISILQLSKIDPGDLEQEHGVDRSSTLLMKASRSYVKPSPSVASRGSSQRTMASRRRRQNDRLRDEGEEEYAATPEEKAFWEEEHRHQEPGVETVMPGLGMGVVGSILRARSSRQRKQTGSSDVTASAIGRPAVFGRATDYFDLDPRGRPTHDPQDPYGQDDGAASLRPPTYPALGPGQTRSESLPVDPEDGTRKYRLYDGISVPPPPLALDQKLSPAPSRLGAGTPLGLRTPPHPHRQGTAISWAPLTSPAGKEDTMRPLPSHAAASYAEYKDASTVPARPNNAGRPDADLSARRVDAKNDSSGEEDESDTEPGKGAAHHSLLGKLDADDGSPTYVMDTFASPHESTSSFSEETAHDKSRSRYHDGLP